MTGQQLARRNTGVAIPTDPITLGNVLAASGFFTDSRDAAQAAVKVMAGQELGFGPVASMTGVYIVKGKVTISANLMAAAIKRHPAYTFRIKEHDEQHCVIDFIEDGEVIGTSAFSMDDAEKAGLVTNGPWKQHPRNMLFARALSNGAKWHCPDIFGGPVYTPDELGAEIDGETGEVVNAEAVTPQPQALTSAPEPAPAATMISPDRATELHSLIGQAVGSGAVNGAALSTIFTASGWDGDAVNAAAVTELTDDQADDVERHLRDALAKAAA
jgi:hypothetical protein